MTRSLSIKTIAFAFLVFTSMLFTSSVCKGSDEAPFEVLRATFMGDKWYYEYLTTNPQVSNPASSEHVIRFCMVVENEDQVPATDPGDVVYFQIYHHATEQDHSKLDWESLVEEIPVPWGMTSLSQIKSYIDAQPEIRAKRAAALAGKAALKARAVEEAKAAKEAEARTQLGADHAQRRDMNAKIKALMTGTKISAAGVVESIDGIALGEDHADFAAALAVAREIAQRQLDATEFKKIKFQAGQDTGHALTSQMNEISRLEALQVQLEKYNAALTAFTDALGGDEANIARAIEAYNQAINPATASSTSAPAGSSGYESSSE